MLGYPKVLKTKEDYEYVRQNFPKERWQADFEKLLNTQKEWFFVKELAAGEVGQSDDTHKVVCEPSFEHEDGATRNYQYELRYNPNCMLMQLGYTVAEVEAILA
jgi:predicted SAM-dependent methyltransferase